MNLVPTSLALASLLALPASPPVNQETSVPESALFQKVIVTGASLSDGYGLRGELEADADFSTIFGAAIRRDSAAVQAHSDMWFFQQPTAAGTRLIEATVKENPTLVVALDYLFWFGFGYADDQDRIDNLKNGLTLLKQVECPLVIADFPDMSIALQGTSPFGTSLIEPEMLPSPELLANMNELIRTWAAERKETYVVPLASFLERLVSEEDVSLRGNEWKGDARAQIFQADLLHPTLDGDLGLTILTLDTLAAGHQGFCEPCVHWSSDEIKKRVLARTQVEREKNREKERKREERRKRREEKKKREKEEKLSAGTPGN